MSWGTRFFDYDSDGDRDVFIANGHLESDVESYENTTFAQRNQIFENVGEGRFEERESSSADDGLAVRKVSRGAAFGDYDEDGDIDILVANVGDGPTLMRNDTEDSHHWLRIRLLGKRSNGAAIDTRVEVYSGSLVQTDQVRSGASYLSQSDLRLHFGLGKAERVDKLVVYWPSGHVEEVVDVAVDRTLVLTEGGEE